MTTKSSFAEIYSQWEKSHDEKARIKSKSSQDDKLSVHVPTINEKRRMKVQDELDLHSVTVESAVSMSRDFLKHSCDKGLFKVRIVTGKGLHSPNFEAVVRPAVISELERSPFVREFNQNPSPADGGSGAVTVILRHTKEK